MLFLATISSHSFASLSLSSLTGSCGGMYTANTMSSIIETMGMGLPLTATAPATSSQKIQECMRAGEAIKLLLEKDIKPKDIMTRDAFENAITVTQALGGSTNAVLHLLAIARTGDIPLNVDDFETIRRKTPLLADLKPSGKYLMEDLHNVSRRRRHRLRLSLLSSRNRVVLEIVFQLFLMLTLFRLSCASVIDRRSTSSPQVSFRQWLSQRHSYLYWREALRTIGKSFSLEI